MKILTFTLHDGRKVGIPQGSAVILIGLEAKADPSAPKAKAMIRYSIGVGARHAWVRDSFKQLRNLFPISLGGGGWTVTQDQDGNDLAFPAGSIRGWEQLETDEQDAEHAEPVFRVTLGCETGPLEFNIRAPFDELMSMLGEQALLADDPDMGAEDGAAPPPPRRSRGGKRDK